MSLSTFASSLADRLDPPDPDVFGPLEYEPTAKQAEFHAATEFDVLYGGAAGGGKTKALLMEGLPAQDYGRRLLMPSARPPAALVPRGRQVCSCLDVSEPQIAARLADCRGTQEQRLAELQQALHCGTRCGSCLPELRRMVRASRLPA